MKTRFLLFSMMVISSLMLNAQSIMNIHQSNGTILQIPLNDIDSVTYTISNLGSLATLTTTTISSITSTSAISGGNITNDGGAPITQRGIVLATSPNPTTVNFTIINGSGTGNYTSNLSGLSANTTYYIRAFATNSAGTAYGNELSFTTNAAGGGIGTYPPGTVHCSGTPTAIVDVTNPNTGKTWMDRNLGASQVATSSTDTNSFGDLYQWGRSADGHQCRNSLITSTLSSIDQPGHSDFIITISNWRNPQNTSLWQGVNGVNNPCPSGYRLPTESELNTERMNWWFNNSAGAFTSPLKLPLAGVRLSTDGSLANVGIIVHYWSSTISSSRSKRLFVNSTGAGIDTSSRANGISVRCLKD